MERIDYKDFIGKHRNHILEILGANFLPESKENLLMYKLEKNIHGRDTILAIYFKADIVHSLSLKNHFWYEKIREFTV